MRGAIGRLAAACVLAVGVSFAGAEGAVAAPVIAAAPPCGASGGACFVFGRGIVGLGTSNFTTFAFTAPSRGTASVTMQGSVVCGADTSAGNKVVDLTMQITNSATDPTLGGAGSMRQAMVLQPNTSQTFNLASTRVFSIGKTGTQTYRFRVRPLRIDSGVTCTAYTLALSVVFVP